MCAHILLIHLYISACSRNPPRVQGHLVSVFTTPTRGIKRRGLILATPNQSLSKAALSSNFERNAGTNYHKLWVYYHTRRKRQSDIHRCCILSSAGGRPPACLPAEYTRAKCGSDIQQYLKNYLHDWRDVDGVPRSSCGGERRLGLGGVSEGVVHPRLDKVSLHQELLVVHALQLSQELVQQRHGVLVLALLEKLAEIKKTTTTKNTQST